MTNLIVGASSGLGKELAYEFAKNSKNLILISRKLGDLEFLKSDLEKNFKIKVNVFEVDFSKKENVSNFISKNFEILSNIDGALFPIGMMIENDNVKNSSEDFSNIFNANFLSIALLISKILDVFEKKNKGFIVGFGSISASMGRKINTAYSGAKKSLENFFESLIISNLNNEIKIQFYTLGYLDTKLTHGKKLLLPKGSPKILSSIVYKNLNQKGVKKFFPFWWIFINFVIKNLPFFISKNIIKYFN